MWQRIQTVYLILIIVCMALTLFFPIATFPFEGSDLDFNAYGLDENSKDVGALPFYIFFALIMAMAVISITRFKNRKSQLNLGKINYLLILTTVVLLFWQTGSIAEQLGLEETDASYGLAMFMPVVCIAFNFLANRAIKADEKLIKSVDRLRG